MTWFLDKPFLEGLDLDAYDPDVIALHTGVSREIAAAFVDPDRRYTVKSNPHYGFLAGEAHGQPALLFIGRPRLESGPDNCLNIVVFGEDGACDFEQIGINPNYFDEEGILGAATAAFGFVHTGLAVVSAFKHPGHWYCALVPFPFHLHDDARGDGDEDTSLARDWIERNNYVLHWGNAYFMSVSGDVESS